MKKFNEKFNEMSQGAQGLVVTVSMGVVMLAVAFVIKRLYHLF